MSNIKNYCKCGCGTEIPDGNTWARGHYVRSPYTREKASKAAKKRFNEMSRTEWKENSKYEWYCRICGWIWTSKLDDPCPRCGDEDCKIPADYMEIKK